MNKVISLEKLRNKTEKVTEEDYHVPAAAPYQDYHLQVNEDFFNPRKKPAWFDLSHLGLDYDKHSVKDAEFVHDISADEDLQKFRFKQNQKRPEIKKSVSSVGKDIREKPIFLVKELQEDGTITYCYIQDGNTFVDVGKELNYPNYLTVEFWKNGNWSEANAIAIGVHLNLLEKPFGVAEEEDIRNGLIAITKTKEFTSLMKNVDKNHIKLSEMLTHYYFKMSGKTEIIASVSAIINDIIFENDEQKKQNLNPSISSITKKLEPLGFKDNNLIQYSVHSADAERILTRHLLSKSKTLIYPTTRLATVIYSSGSVTHDKYWWIKEAIGIIEKVEEYMELHKGSKILERFSIAGIYQSHVGTTRFELGTIVPVEEVKKWAKELRASNLIT